ncbi:UDP-N-acetylmuramoyl-L-alanine--D-glutamate ligase [Nocardioides pacificus]
MRFSDLAGRRVVVWGYGTEGRAVERHLVSLGIDAVIALPDSTPTTYDVEPALPVLYGDEAARALEAADVVVKSPGIPAASDRYRRLSAAGVGITSMLDLWLSDNHERTIAVTGTKGKSTTSSLLHHLLGGLGVPSALVGNIGVPVLDAPPSPVWAVVEVSSYQAQSLSVSPRAALVTSLFPEHLPWHGSVEQYYADKLHLLDFGPEVVVSNGDDDRLCALVADHAGPGSRVVLTGPGRPHVSPDGSLVWPGVGRLEPDELPLPGRHNAANAAMALLLVVELGLVPAGREGEALALLTSFQPLAHRLETVPSTDGRLWVDDGLATAPEAVVAALGSWPDTHVALVFGGQDRGLDFSPLLDHLLARSGPLTVLCIGAAGERFLESAEAVLSDREERRGLPLILGFSGLEAAARWAHSEQNPAEVVLLSPGATSFDEFTDYVARSARFREIAAG